MNRAEPARDAGPFAPFDELLAQGVISREEHAQHCHILALDIVRLNRAHQKRLGPGASASELPTFSPLPHKEPQMNTKDLLESMQLNNRVMSEQFRTLNTLARQTPSHTVQGGHSADNTADLLNHLTNTHLGNAAQSIQALAGATARAREEWARAQHEGHGHPATRAADADAVIDVEVVEVKGSDSAAPPAPPPAA